MYKNYKGPREDLLKTDLFMMKVLSAYLFVSFKVRFFFCTRVSVVIFSSVKFLT